MKNWVIRTFLTLAIIFSMTGFFGANSVSASGTLSGWANRIQLTIDRTKITSPLSNFPVMVHLSAKSGLNGADLSSVFNSLGNNSKKIAITTADGTTQCYAEIEQWNSAIKQAYLWVKVPNISNTSDTVLYLYYDNAHADNTSFIGDAGSAVSQNVWDSNHMGVYHMNQQGNGTAGEIKDSTSRQHHGKGASDAGRAVPAAVQTRLGIGQAFNGGANNNYNVRNYVVVPDNNDFTITTTGKLTFSVWYNPNVTLNWPDNNTGGDYVHTIGKGRSGGNWEWDMGLGLDNSSVSKYLGIMNYEFNQSGGLGDGVGLGPFYQAPSNHPEWNQHYKVGDWLYIAGIYDNSARTMTLTVYYCDGTQKLIVKATRTNSGWNYLNSPGNTSEALYIGSVPDQYFDGILDEFRISNNVRSDAWINASFYSESDRLITFGTVGTPSPTPTPTPTPTGNTFGLNSGNNVWSDSGNVLNAMRFQNTARTGSLNKLELLINDTAPAGKVRLGVYADNAGRPGTRLLDAGEVIVVNGWVSLSGLNLPVTQGSYYWLAFNLQNSNGVSFLTSGSNTAGISHYWANGTAYGTLPASFNLTGAGNNLAPYVMRATISTSTVISTPTPTPTPTPTTLTFGLNSGNNVWADSGNVLNAMRYQNTAGIGTLNKLELLINDTTPNGEVRLGVYTDNAGRPGARLLDAGEVTVTNGWVSLSGLSLPVSLNGYYWLAFNQQTANGISFLTSGSNTAGISHYWANGTAYGTLPASFNLTGSGNNLGPYIMRATVAK